MARIVCAVSALFLVLAAPAGAQLRAIGERTWSGPVLFGDRVLWAEAGTGVARVLAAPIAGGPAAEFGSVGATDRDTVELRAGTAKVAVLARDARALGAQGRLFTAGADGAFAALATNVGEGPITGFVPSMQVGDPGVLTLEGGVGAFLRDETGRAQEVAVPPDADPSIVAAGGTFGVAPTPDGILVVFDLRTDTEVRHISLGRFDAATVNGIAISPAGDVALTVPIGDGSDVLLWAPVGATQVREVRRGRAYSTVVIAGRQVAWVNSDDLHDGARVTVVDAATNRTVFSGPPASDVRALSFNGSDVAFATASCAFVGPASPQTSRRTLPAGPCLQSDVGINQIAPAVRDDRYRVRVACINAPASRCRLHARVTTRDGKLAGRLDARPARGGARTLEIALNARGRAEPSDRLHLQVTLSDPDGRTRTIYDG